MIDPQVLIGSKFVENVLPLIHEAKHSIDIIVYDWRVYPSAAGHPVSRLTEALVVAARRGVGVRALVNNRGIRDSLISQGIKARILQDTRILHAKAMLIDGRICVCGSHNYTQGGMMINHEVSLVVDLQSSDNLLQNYFNDLYGI